MPDDRVADRVSADMERIFRRHAPAAAATERAANARSRDFVVHTVPDRPVPSRLVRLVTIGIPLIAIAVVAFLFLQIGSHRRPGAAIAQVPATRPAPAAPARSAPVAYQATAPVAADDAVAGDAAMAERTAVDMPRNEDREGDRGWGGDRGAADPATAPIRRSRTATRAVAAPAARAPSASASADAGCRPGSEENHCIYREVRAADRRLVAAYQDATDAGVSRRELLAVRRVWTRALAVSLDDPDGTIRTYDQLARRLRDAARMAQTDDDRT